MSKCKMFAKFRHSPFQVYYKTVNMRNVRIKAARGYRRKRLSPIYWNDVPNCLLNKRFCRKSRASVTTVAMTSEIGIAIHTPSRPQ